MKLFLTFLSFIVSCFTVSACDCAPLGKIAKEQTDKYNIIFTGTIDSVSACAGDKSIAWFSITQLFKGETTKSIGINFDCVSSCRMRLQAGEVWLIYAQYEKFGDLRVTYCGRSRKFAADINDDHHLSRTGMSYSEEISFLRDNYGIQQPSAHTKEVIEPLERELIKPKGWQTVWLLAGSLVGMIIIWIIVKKFIR